MNAPPTYVKFFVIALVIVSVGLAAYSLWQYIKKTKENKYVPNLDNTNPNAKSADVYFFYTTWCPHSTTALPEWRRFVSQYQNSTINGYYLNFVEVDCTTESVEVDNYIKKFSIMGYPTIKVVKDGHIIEFDANATFDNIKEFLTSVL
jgi:thiol-disulfide isomerase/thioredoxin